MEESDCIVCFSQYDDKEHRPRSMPCGHTMCSKCLKRAIREQSNMCPKCRSLYAALYVEELPVNFSLEGMVKSLKISGNTNIEKQNECASHPWLVNHTGCENAKADKLPECPEHQLPVSFRCSAHKAWICQSCLIEDHSSQSCKIITIKEELDNKKSRQLDLSEPFLNRYKESCKKAKEYKIQFEIQKEENKEDIIRYESMISRLQEEIQRKKNYRIKIEGTFAMFDKKLDNLNNRRESYNQAVTSLELSRTIREVSTCSVRVQKEAENLKLMSDYIDCEIELMLQTFKLKSDHLIGYHKLSIRYGKPHMHVLQDIDTYKLSPCNIESADKTCPLLTDGLLTFLDISWPGQDPRRIYMRMLGNTALARQHLLLVTGQCGHSYRNLHFGTLVRKDQPGEHLMICSYDGNRAAPLLSNIVAEDVYTHERKAGLVTGAMFADDPSNFNNAIFGVVLRDWPRAFDRCGFGQVTSGIEILKDIAKSDERDQIKVVDCGVVLFW